MHRSGTSALTRALNIVGAYLGPESQLVRPARDNPTGFWEFEPIVKINDGILARLGGRSMDPPKFASDWHRGSEFDDLRERAVDILDAHFGGATFWAFKDPRACLTLGFWEELLPPMRYVVCFRNPDGVAASLHRRNRIAEARSIYLWLLYNRSALLNTRGKVRCGLAYEDLVKSPEVAVRRLIDFLGVEGADDAAMQSIGKFIKPGQRHDGSKTPPAPSMRASDIISRARIAACDAYDVLCRSGLESAEVEETLEAGLAGISRDSVTGKFSYKY